MKQLLTLLFLSAPAYCQLFSIGVKGGLLLNQPFSAPDNRETLHAPRWTVGPTVEVKLPFRLSIGFDALYRNADDSSSRSVGSTLFSSSSHTSLWEFPLYVKYRIIDVPLRPFVAAGGAFNYSRTNGTASCTGDVTLCGPGDAGTSVFHFYDREAGFVLSGGLEFRFAFLKLAPEFRYTRWQSEVFPVAGWNQLEALLGIRF